MQAKALGPYDRELKSPKAIDSPKANDSPKAD
jgi:hypothetical protein